MPNRRGSPSAHLGLPRWLRSRHTGARVRPAARSTGRKTLDTFLAGWRAGNLDQVGFVTPDGDGVPASEVVAQIKSLSGELWKNPPKLTVAREPEESEGLATAEVTVDWTLAGDVHWTYPTTVRLSKVEEGWRVVWEPAVVHTDLTAGDCWRYAGCPRPRASILDGAGEPIVDPAR